MLSLLDSWSTSDHMATPVSRSLPYGIGHVPMPDHFAAAIRSLSSENTGHDRTGTSSGTLIDILPASPVRSSHRLSPVQSPVWSGQVTGLVRSSYRSSPVRSGHYPHRSTSDCPVQSPVRSPKTLIMELGSASIDI
ncbi:hypothetical protein DPMN_023985 [Dreissena polymorpha]|uniref:Uncharacterized protein n=1 Tax=Dreissena polymorpha TaxID=45954 RepID=A0A9D4LNX7_DREPO|nr:hypothetical protein DPMN_023985 [Dreissena polymorpha]